MRTSLVTGGAGFVGTNLADRLLRQGGRVVLLDDLSRAGVTDNLAWLQAQHGERLQVEVGDVRDAALVRRAVGVADEVFHFAAQVAVTTSVADPLADFGVNLTGTLTVLEALRGRTDPPPLLFTSTNKVYGKCHEVDVARVADRYAPVRDDLRQHGLGEDQPLQFSSPYGCSKGAADQYVLDYADTYGLPAVVFRMSCIYGPHQQGNEDQGWVAHFLKQALAGRPITLFGDGRQVRDVLFVDDLVDAMQLAVADASTLSGRAFNMGGGPEAAVSLLELLALVADVTGVQQEVLHGPWRVGDQRYYVSDTRRFTAATGWVPTVRPAQGVAALHAWLTRPEPAGAAPPADDRVRLTRSRAS